ncbi:hypothetical protein OEA41_009018 [Lepraria neglecta]|uniref:Multiple myeloma tumor-associated protein 2-like N-terminal domain-containing protein n=1 Tax=Lepraria neglecta TaxID=209136 RepID=A0AAD9Z0T9_9LECA|nr:hypothetical protein OEA41_009018 [Lepraria neglecta]
MDLVAGVRKEGSRGGRGDFKWEDVRDSQHRENYLGHSLMAPVGRWQKNKDLSWYAKSDTSPAALTAAEQRKEEIRKIKEAEESALSEALGYGPTMSKNANETPLGQKDVERAIKETAEGEEEGAKGVGFGGFEGVGVGREDMEVLGGVGLEVGGVNVVRERERDGEGKREKRRRRRSGSRDRSRERRHRRNTGVIGGIDRRIGHGIGLEIGQGVGDRIDESGLGATRGGEKMIDHPDGRENGAIRLIFLDGEGTLEIEIMTTDDETKYAVLNESCTLTA